MTVAIENFIQLDNPNKIIVLGDMFELGWESQQEHGLIVNLLSGEDNIICYFVGSNFYTNKIKKENFNFHETFDLFSKHFQENKIEDATILIKGSRGMALERTLDLL